MKYIRTKDKIYGSEKWENHPTPSGKNVYYDINCNAPVIKKDDVIKQADTIDELCDCYIYESNIDDDFDVMPFKEAIPNYTCYGAIKTEKGIIKVAKMNEKGELELL